MKIFGKWEKRNLFVDAILIANRGKNAYKCIVLLKCTYEKRYKNIWKMREDEKWEKIYS